MSLLLSDYRTGGADAGIVDLITETMVSESQLLNVLTFDELTDNNVSRQRMYEESDVQEHSVGDTWAVVNPTWVSRDAPLTILGDNVTVDNFGTLGAGTKFATLMASQIQEKARGMSRRFDRLAIYANTTTTGRLSGSVMVGLLEHIARVEGASVTDLDGWLYSSPANYDSANNKQVVQAASGAATALTLAMVDVLRDTVRPKATAFIMSRASRRKIEALARAAGTNMEIREAKLGQRILNWDGIDILVNDEIKDNMDDATAVVTDISSYNYDQASSGTADSSPIFAVAIGPKDFTGINGVGLVQVEDLAGGGAMETLDAKGKRVKAYLGTALRKKEAAAVLVNAIP